MVFLIVKQLKTVDLSWATQHSPEHSVTGVKILCYGVHSTLEMLKDPGENRSEIPVSMQWHDKTI